MSQAHHRCTPPFWLEPSCPAVGWFPLGLPTTRSTLPHAKELLVCQQNKALPRLSTNHSSHLCHCALTHHLGTQCHSCPGYHGSHHQSLWDLNFLPSNARWLSPGRLSSRKDNCILQIHRINAVATSVRTTMCIQKRTELDRYIIHWAVTVQNKKANNKDQKPNKTHTQTPKKHTENQHGRWSADQFTGIWNVPEEMITLYHPRDWYGKGKQERTNNTTEMPYSNLWARTQQRHNAETKAPPSQEPRDHSVQAARATFSQILGHNPKSPWFSRTPWKLQSY